MSYDNYKMPEFQALVKCLNPFGTGQCLTTAKSDKKRKGKGLNPFGTGQCLTTEERERQEREERESQSLWNRAMSYDDEYLRASAYSVASQSLWNRAMSYDCNRRLLVGKL